MKMPWAKKEKTLDTFVNDNADSTLISALMQNDSIITKELARQVPAIAASIDLIAQSTAAVNFKLYEVLDDGTKQEIPKDYRLDLLNGDTGDTLDAGQMWKAVVDDYFLDKGGYIYIDKSGNLINSLRYVEANKVTVKSNIDPIFKRYEIQVGGHKFEDYEFIKLLRNSKNGSTGSSIIKTNSELINNAIQVMNYEKINFKKGGNKRGFFQSERKLSKDALEALKDAFRRLYSDKADNAVVLNEGIKFEANSYSPAELELQEIKKNSNRNIFNLFKISASIFEGNASETDYRKMYETAVKPILDSILIQLNKYLLLENEKNSKFFDYDIADLLKGDAKARFEQHQIALQQGFKTIDEIRTIENMKPLGLPFVKLNLADALYDPTTKVVYAINTNSTMKLDDLLNEKGGEKENEDKGGSQWENEL